MSTAPNESSPKKQICIIGAGVSGIIAASVLQVEGHDVVVFDKASSVGGIWSNAYPEASLQNSRAEYRHPDFPFSEDPELHPTAFQVQSYFEQCVKHFGLTVRLKTTVSSLIRNSDESWEVTTVGSDGQISTETFSFCVIAKGHYGLENVTLPWKGVETFRGQLLTRTMIDDLSVISNKRVLVLGFGKTALDMCQFACDHGATSVIHCFRTPRHIVPNEIFGIHYTWLLFNRIHNMTIPCWDHAFPIMSLLHVHFGFLFYGFWSLIQIVSWFWQTRSGWFETSDKIRNRFKMLKPDAHLLRDHRSAAPLAPPRYFSYVGRGMIEPLQGNVDEVIRGGVRLGNGKEIQADIILACVGNLAQTETFEFLPKSYRKKMEDSSGGLQLYRHVVHPSLPGLAFVGWNHGFMHCPQNYLASLWLSCMLKGEIALPSTKEQLRCIERVKAWKKENISFEPNANGVVATRHQHYLDVLMQDLGLNPFRKSNPIAEIFARYEASDYSGIVDELQKKRKDAIEAGRVLELHAMDRDM